MLGGDIEYVGEVGHDEKFELLGGATALLNPLQWEEPLTMMIEALAVGTPVVVTPRGAAPEIVQHGVTGFRPSRRTGRLPAAGGGSRPGRLPGRRSGFDAGRMVADHVALYEEALNAAAGSECGRPQQESNLRR